LAYQEYLYLWKQNVHYQYTKTHFKSVKSSPDFQSFVLHSVQFNINFTSYTSASHILSFHEASQPKFCTHLVLLCQPHVQTISYALNMDYERVVKKIFESKMEGRRIGRPRLRGWKMLKRIYGRWRLKDSDRRQWTEKNRCL